jgi:tetraprenyl-beta-curcumene synthase
MSNWRTHVPGAPGLALAVANARYWSTVAPRVRAELARWEQRAQEIPDPALQEPAQRKLRAERFNVEVAATLATTAPRAHRRPAVEAIVAIQVMYDYLDLVSEQRPADPMVDGVYLAELAATVRLALARLPAAGAVAATARRSAERCAAAQVLSHAAARAEPESSGPAIVEVERWARREAAGTGLQWPEFLAGAGASVLAVHALIAAAADRRTTPADAEAIDALYLKIGALTMLDSLVDHEEDAEAGEVGYLRWYESPEQMAQRLAAVAADARARARALPHGAHHVMILVGVVAYYLSAPTAPARPATERLRSELRPLIVPTLALMRAWRLAKRARSRDAHHREPARVTAIVKGAHT